jgi:hypothetical protein
LVQLSRFVSSVSVKNPQLCRLLVESFISGCTPLDTARRGMHNQRVGPKGSILLNAGQRYSRQTCPAARHNEFKKSAPIGPAPFSLVLSGHYFIAPLSADCFPQRLRVPIRQRKFSQGAQVQTHRRRATKYPQSMRAKLKRAKNPFAIDAWVSVVAGRGGCLLAGSACPCALFSFLRSTQPNSGTNIATDCKVFND